MSNSDKNLTKPSNKDCLDIANRLIVWGNLLVPQVNHIAEINSYLIGLLYEKITGSSLPDFISGGTRGSEEEEIQAIINALSLDILQLSLSHITGEAVVAGDVVAIYNLLHVLEGILLHSTSSGEQAFPKRKVSRLKRRETPKESVCEKTPSPLDIEKIFERNVELKLETELIKNSHSLKSKSERHRPQHSNKPLKKSTYPYYCNKSYLLPRKKHSKHPPLKNISIEKSQNLERSHKEGTRSQTKFIQELLDEFPCIQISPSLMKNIERKYAHHLIGMHKLMKECLLKRTKASIKAENISKRQLKLVEILKKDISQQHYLKKMKEEKENERKIKYSLRDSRMRSAKMKQYSDEFIVDMRKKMMKKNIKEELIFKNVFEEIMDIQSEHIDYLCEQMKDAKIKDDEQYLNYLCSLENLYQSQYLALSEEIANEKSDAQSRLNAERLASQGRERVPRNVEE
ncbi:centrosomal protein of 95 kDa isoform X2 [Parasteatoda tepidariorum]|uniref:centrosomal protein of 95 kDa isoform X2 n=1 Tax=Parasteatoda tepidariorum TaxID=114398 RepID=UPI0039BD23C2